MTGVEAEEALKRALANELHHSPSLLWNILELCEGDSEVAKIVRELTPNGSLQQMTDVIWYLVTTAINLRIKSDMQDLATLKDVFSRNCLPPSSIEDVIIRLTKENNRGNN